LLQRAGAALQNAEKGPDALQGSHAPPRFISQGTERR